MERKGCPDVCPNYGTCVNDQCTCLPSLGGKDCIWKQCNATLSSEASNQCVCAEGFLGRNCNVCRTDSDCKFFRGADLNPDENKDDPILCNPTTYVYKRHHITCGVIAGALDKVFREGPKSITLTRVKDPNMIMASFWIDDKEQFMCQATECTNEIIAMQDIWKCKYTQCKCHPTSIMCEGTKNIGVGNVLRLVKDELVMSCPFVPTYPLYKDHKLLEQRPAVLNTTENRKCTVKMVDLKNVLPDGFELIDCHAGECGRLSSFNTPLNFRSMQWTARDIIFLTFFSGILSALLILLVLCLIQRHRYRGRPVSPPSTPKEYTFADVSYTLGKKTVLRNLKGSFPPCTLTAIIGPSGAGKSSLLDILAHKPKRGTVTAEFELGGLPLASSDKEFRHMVGFVDQEDVLLPWFTVLESLWFVADTRLPESLSKKEKECIIEEALSVLNISHIRNSRIGGAATFRGISGGERRRVSVAVELITSPCILFLDEPTTGLDSHNAHKLMKCLANLAHHQNKTIICTIHQPRHDVYALFDQIFLMSQGLMLYQGAGNKAKRFLESRGFYCPPDRHICDFMIDLTVQPEVVQRLMAPFILTSSAESKGNTTCFEGFKSKCCRFFTIPKLRAPFPFGNKTKAAMQTSFYQVSYLTQFKCLLWRSIQCSLRNKRLFFGHNLIAIALGAVLGLFYMHTSQKFAGFINLVGLIIFLHLIIAFSSFSALSNMSSDRLLFMRERGNACYRPSTYFLSKLLIDLIPLRLLPTLFLGLIVYFISGFTISAVLFGKFMLVLLLFTTSVTLVSMVIGVAFSDFTLANFISSVTMLLFVLFSGIWVNLSNMTPLLRWIQYLSPFRWSSEALSTSQLALMTFDTEFKGRTIPLNGSVFLNLAFGLEVDEFSRNIYILVCFNISLLILLGLLIVFKLKEIR